MRPVKGVCIGHGLGTTQLLAMTLHYWLKNCETAQRHNFTSYLEMSEKANV